MGTLGMTAVVLRGARGRAITTEDRLAALIVRRALGDEQMPVALLAKIMAGAYEQARAEVERRKAAWRGR